MYVYGIVLGFAFILGFVVCYFVQLSIKAYIQEREKKNEGYHVESPVPLCPNGGIYPKGMRIGQLPVTNIYNAYSRKSNGHEGFRKLEEALPKAPVPICQCGGTVPLIKKFNSQKK